MSKKGHFNVVKLTLDISGFTITIGGALIARFSKDEYLPIIGGIMVAVGMALLGVSRLVK